MPGTACGPPGSGRQFAIVLGGQDGYRPGQTRPGITTAGPGTFGLCAAGAGGPVRAADPAAGPKGHAHPDGHRARVLLGFTRGPVRLRGVPPG